MAADKGERRMVIIWGTRVRYRIHAEGEFFCPECGGDRLYRKLLARRWFTLFWIPVIPRRRVWWVVACGECGHHYRPAVLDKPTIAAMSRMLQGAARALVMYVLRNGGNQDNPVVRRQAVEQIRAVRPEGYDDSTLEEDLFCVPRDPAPMLNQIAEHLDSAGREALLVRGVRVALADGPFNAGELSAIQVAGRALEMTPAHVAGVLLMARRSVDNPGS
ncbi:hypothetical protein [Carbonactinospora thermoautotrophica]|uniref:hypothetical protein n=1 Tax=Carbonactinospora thermoautotrophica TaxID=1469144 RepID=UPI00226E7410|nr:hypothetical protein [Carbonactinospora thermoautotrophica]